MKTAQPEPPARHWLDAWHVDPSANREYDFIDGLRGMAILMVLSCHYLYVNPKSGPAIHFLGSILGTLGSGVTLFFTISGFLIAWPFWKRKANRSASVVPPGYGWRRFWKIYPPLALSILLLTPTYILWQGDATLFLQAASQWLTGLAFVLPVSGRLNPVMWSLMVEVHFYLVLPLLFVLTKALSPRATLWTISAFFLVAPILMQTLTGVAPTFFPQISDPFPAGLKPFCLGVFLAGIDNLGMWNRRWGKLGNLGWLLLPMGLLGQAWIDRNPNVHAPFLAESFQWTFIIGAGCLLCHAADPQNSRARWLCMPWLRWCGIISYEWYLFHQPMIYWSRGFFGPAGGGILKYIIIIGTPLVASLVFSALIYRHFSLPILKYGRAKKSVQKIVNSKSGQN